MLTVRIRYNRPTIDWFVTPDGLDEICKDEFGHLVEDARANRLDHWQADREGSLALVILLDQFTRNIYRGTPDAFSSDPKALDVATKAIAKGWDKQSTTTQAMTLVCHVHYVAQDAPQKPAC